MTTTPVLGLEIFNTASGSATTFLNYRLNDAGLSSNMTKIDDYAGVINNLFAAYGRPPIRVVGTQITGNYYEATVAEMTQYSANSLITLSLDVTITGTTTLNINAIGVKTLKKIDSSGSKINLVSGDIQAGYIYLFLYDNVDFVYATTVMSDQVSIAGTANNFMSISGSNKPIDSGVPILSGRTTGSYTSVTIDAYGRVLSGSSMPVISIASGSYSRVGVDAYGRVVSGSYNAGASGSFVDKNNAVVTVVNGLITNISY